MKEELVFVVRSRYEFSGHSISWEFPPGCVEQIVNPLLEVGELDADALEIYFLVRLRPEAYCFVVIDASGEKGGVTKILMQAPFSEHEYEAFVEDGHSVAGIEVYDRLVEHKLGISLEVVDESCPPCDVAGRWLEYYEVCRWSDANPGDLQPSCLEEAIRFQSIR